MSITDVPPLSSSEIDAQRVTTLFASPSRSAPSGFLRREISARMQERLDYLRIHPSFVLDAGCGTGEDGLALQQRYAKAQLIGVDSAAAMLTLAETRVKMSASPLQRWLKKLSGHRPASWMRADMSTVPLPAATVDLLWSNLALHWHPHPENVFAEWHRLLRAESALLFSCFGPDTFKEVRQAFASVDAAPHTLAFADMHDLGDALMRAGFPSPIMDRETLTLTYDSPRDLIADVRAFGGNPLMQRRRGLMSRVQGARVIQALEAMRETNGVIPLTVEVVYGHAFKFAATRTTQGEAVVQFMKRG